MQNPDVHPIFRKPARTPGHGPKKRTCPGKSGRMVTLTVCAIVLDKKLLFEYCLLVINYDVINVTYNRSSYLSISIPTIQCVTVYSA